MLDYTFKVYMNNGTEHFRYGERNAFLGDRIIEKRFPFPESLLSLLYLDTEKIDPLTKKMDRALMEFYGSKDDRLLDTVLTTLDELSQVHIYFELVRLVWRHKIKQYRREMPKDVMDALPHKRLSHIPAEVGSWQKQIKRLFDEVLDMDGDKRSVPEKMVAYYEHDNGFSLRSFQFTACPMHYQVIGYRVFAEVLEPESLYDIVNFEVRECVARELRLRHCKYCGLYFAPRNAGAEYCTRIFDRKGRTCKDVGAIALWTKTKGTDAVFKEFRREYKKRFARTRAGTLTEDGFHAWSERARKEKERCDAGEITLDEFHRWLLDS